MSNPVMWIIPEAPAPVLATVQGEHREIKSAGLRLGILDNAKGNADHLLRMIIEGVKAKLPIDTVVSLRKPGPGVGATAEVLDQLAVEADCVVSAMAD